MKLLITGANGYLGQNLCPHLVTSGHSVTTLTRRPWALPGTINQVTPIIAGSTYLKDCLMGQEVVVHLAAVAHHTHSGSAKIEAHYWAINVEQTKALALMAAACGVKRFVYISSIKVNGEATHKNPYRFDTPPKPEDVYGRSKWAAEQALHTIFDGSATELVILRPPLIWGGAMKGNLALLQKCARWGVPLPFGAVDNRRDLVSVQNLSSLITVVLNHPNAAGQTLLVSDGIARSTADIINLITVFQPKVANIPNCPLSILRALMHIPCIGGSLKKLTTNLELDITPTCNLLDWYPHT
jgi:nucleoside-diphosphate-sugar epimerase